MTSVAIPNMGEVLAAGIVFAPVCTVVVALRFAARRYQQMSLHLDDWLTIPALLGTLGICAVLIWGTATQSLGYPTPEPPPDQDPLTFQNDKISTAKIVVWVIEQIQCVSLTCTKMSCLFFYRRIFYTGYNGWFRRLTMFLIVFTTVWAVTFFIAFWTECAGHVSAWWTDIETLNTYCGPSLDIEIAFAVSDTAVDLAVLIVPMVVVVKLRMSWIHKLAVAGIFSIGALAVAASITRMIVFIQVITALKSAYHTSGANDSFVTVAVYWATIESGLALMVACLPIFYSVSKELFRRIVVGPNRSRSHSASRSTSRRKTFPRPRHWPLSNLTDLVTTRTGNKEDTETGESWSLHDQIPMIARPARTALIEAHAVAATTPQTPREGDQYSYKAPAWGEIRVKKQIDQTVDFV